MIDRAAAPRLHAVALPHSRWRPGAACLLSLLMRTLRLLDWIPLKNLLYCCMSCIRFGASAGAFGSARRGFCARLGAQCPGAPAAAARPCCAIAKASGSMRHGLLSWRRINMPCGCCRSPWHRNARPTPGPLASPPAPTAQLLAKRRWARFLLEKQSGHLACCGQMQIADGNLLLGCMLQTGVQYFGGVQFRFLSAH